ncbi:LysR family transcriptional regulator [Agromyces albus]|uniref:LysR family transcriptional regulator n=1 Tax=Agromyces albus TaxID=205332 RepID=UPI0027822DF5|nr:LysR family transcriptional regulator [Agromyces albus]MDQ0573831.1 DNA-binding transcriptional LysR family regulator [Agromyces albus]
MAQTPTGPGRLDIDLQTIRVIRAIEETGSITGASRALGLSQPAISQHLQRAETRLGVPLLVRTGRTIRLSEAGQVLADIAPQISDALDHASTQITGLASLNAGRVSLAGFPSASSTIVPTLLSTMRESRPGISMSYTEAEPPDATQLVLDGQCDVAIIASYPSEPLDLDALHRQGLWVKTLFLDQMLLILPEGHPLADERIVDLIALQDDEWIAGCPRCRGHVVDVCAAVGYEPNITLETDNFIAALGMVSRGLGIAVLPRLSLGTAAIPKGAVVRRLNPHANREIHVIAPESAVSTGAVRATLATLAALDGAAWKMLRPSHVARRARVFSTSAPPTRASADSPS